MKKQLSMLLPLLAMVLMTGCSTYQYSSRSVDINRTPIGTKRAAAEVKVDYGRTVTATSDYQLTKNDAIREAEHLCIVNNGIDVIVDPIFKVEYSPFELQKRYKATVTGYAGKYAPAEAGVEAAKEYDMKDIEKYKMLTDPSFPQYYYNKATGDSYYINTTGAPAVGASSGKSPVASSLAFAPKKTAGKVQSFDFNKAKTLRNTGVGLTIGGAVAAALIGGTCSGWAMSDAANEKLNSLNYNASREEYSAFEDRMVRAEDAGIAFIYVGTAAFIAGVPCWIVGSKRMKKANQNADLSMGGTKNGLGLRLRF